jgi:hypothetical protein
VRSDSTQTAFLLRYKQCGEKMDPCPFGGYVDMKYEQNRFNSFLRSSQTRDLRRFKKFASAGFRILNGEIVCYACNLSLGSFFGEDDVFEQHQSRNPNCLFVRGLQDNVTMSMEVGF